jgi:acetylornithine deacetylase/succinyl-diaminopimelate desuccinylase-like protein
MRLLARAGLVPRGRVLAVMGTAEEHDWDGMRRYADAEPHARYVVSLDASFPVVVAESGFVAFRVGAPVGGPRRGDPRARAVDVRGGNFLTQVPGDARLVLEPAHGETPDALLERVQAAVAQEAARSGSFTIAAANEDERVVIRTTGVAVHSSQADEGHNALWPLAGVAARLPLQSNGITDVLRLVHEKLDGDHWGERLGLAYDHPVMGRLLVTPTTLRLEEGRAVLGINMRRPAGLTSAEFGARLDTTLANLRREVSSRLQEVGERHVGEPHLATTTGPLVDTLLEIYRRHTGQADTAPISIRGGTYARLFPGAVSFGPELPGRTYRGHAPDEWIELETLDLYARMILDATLRLDARAPSAP